LKTSISARQILADFTEANTILRPARTSKARLHGGKIEMQRIGEDRIRGLFGMENALSLGIFSTSARRAAAPLAFRRQRFSSSIGRSRTWRHISGVMLPMVARIQGHVGRPSP